MLPISKFYIIQKFWNLLLVINNNREKIDMLTIMQNHAKLLVYIMYNKGVFTTLLVYPPQVQTSKRYMMMMIMITMKRGRMLSLTSKNHLNLFYQKSWCFQILRCYFDMFFWSLKKGCYVPSNYKTLNLKPLLCPLRH